MRRHPVSGAAVGLLLAAAMAACGTKPAAAPPLPAPPAATAAAGTPFAAAGPLTEKPDFAKQLENFQAAGFTTPTKVTNQWLTLTPGTQRTYDGSALEEGETIKRHFVQTVTDLTKPVMGVPTVVVWDQDFDNGVLKESELAFFAQADNGDLWNFGEFPVEYDEVGKVVSALTWIGGLQGASPGIIMKATNTIGDPSYSQGFAPVVPWTDRARVAQVGVKDCVPQGCYEDVMVLDEFNREEPGATQQKFYARGIGNTRVSFGGNDASKEVLELTKLTTLDAAGLDAARAEALKLDASARELSREVYGQSAPIDRPPGK